MLQKNEMKYFNWFFKLNCFWTNYMFSSFERLRIERRICFYSSHRKKHVKAFSGKNGKWYDFTMFYKVKDHITSSSSSTSSQNISNSYHLSFFLQNASTLSFAWWSWNLVSQLMNILRCSFMKQQQSDFSRRCEI